MYLKLTIRVVDIGLYKYNLTISKQFDENIQNGKNIPTLKMFENKK